MNRRQFMKTAGLLAGAAGVWPALTSGVGAGDETKAGGAARPDVLFVAIEDIAPLMGCYGHPAVKTPNIDALARRGVLFDRAYCQAAVCNPSRASVITGLRPTTTGVYGNGTDWRRRIPAGHRTLPELFQAGGYETAICGKIVHHPRYFKDVSEEGNRREARMWDRKLPARSRGAKRPAKRPKAPRPDFLAKDHYIARSLRWGPTGLADAEQRDGAIALAVAKALRAKRGKPLFLAVGFHSPHYTLVAPDKYIDMYPPEKIALPTSPPGDLDDVPGKYGVFNTTDDKWLGEAEKREVIAAYYACISYVDACVGVLMKALKDAGRENSTIVCLWGDHGMHLGEHFLWRKHTLFENAARVPFLIVAPDTARVGAVCRRPVELVDIYPTLADLCGLDAGKGLDGVSMKRLLRDPAGPWKRAAFTHRGPTNRTLRTERWRYTEWGSPDKAELYDHQTDGGEFRNLAGNPKHAKTLAELRKLMRAGPRAAP